MEPDASAVDSIARIVSYTGLSIAIFVGLIQFLVYRRGRRQNPQIRLRIYSENPIILEKPFLLIIRLFLDNPSSLPNTITEIKCKMQKHLFSSIYLRVGNLRVTFTEMDKPKKEKDSKMRLESAPNITLDDADWKLLLESSGIPLKEGLWFMPFFIREMSSKPIVVVITSNHSLTNNKRKLKFMIRDITNKSYNYVLKL